MQSHPSDDAIQQLVDDDFAGAPSLRAHLEDCGACARLVADYRALRGGVAQIRTYEQPPSFAARMVERLIEERRAAWSAVEIAGATLAGVAWLGALVWISAMASFRSSVEQAATLLRTTLGQALGPASAPLVVTLLVCLTLFALFDRFVRRPVRGLRA